MEKADSFFRPAMKKAPPMKSRVFFWSLVSALAGFLFGFDTVVISEIFPNQYRAAGQSLGSSTHWVCATALTTFFPKMVEALAPGYVFLFFCGMMVLQLISVKTMVPETKGVSLAEIQRKLGIV